MSIATSTKPSDELLAASGQEGGETPFFICGCGRSGTTLLRAVMLGHSRLNVSPETHYIRHLVGHVPLSGPLSPEQVTDAVNRIVAHPRWKEMGVTNAEFRAEAMALPSPRLADVLNLVYLRHAREAGKARPGDKTPDYIRYVPQLLEIYPGARFIHLVRDGHDVAISYAEVGWGQAYQGQDFEWTQAVRAALSYRSMPFADRILEVRYEDMVSDLEGTIKRICAFLGEDFEPGMLQWHGQIDKLNESPKLHSKLRQPLLSDAVAAWRRKLTTMQCFLIEASLYRDLEAMNYQLRYSGAFWRLLLFPVGVVMHALAPFLDRALPALKRRSYLRGPVYI